MSYRVLNTPLLYQRLKLKFLKFLKLFSINLLKILPVLLNVQPTLHFRLFVVAWQISSIFWIFRKRIYLSFYDIVIYYIAINNLSLVRYVNKTTLIQSYLTFLICCYTQNFNGEMCPSADVTYLPKYRRKY